MATAGRPFWPRRNWWLALLAILLLAGALRYPGYAFSLPYLDQSDEIFFALPARMIIDFGTAKSINFHQYPPGIIQIYYLVMRLFHDPATPAASVIWIVRLIAITTSLGVISLLALFGYHAAGRAAGLLGAAFWSITPLFVNNSRWGTAEIFVAFFSILALYCAYVGMRYRRESWTTHATYALMLAIVFKYHCVFLAPAVLFAPLWQKRISRKRVLANTGRFALFSAWLILLTPALDAYFVAETAPNPDWVHHLQPRGAPNPLAMYHNFRFTLAHYDWRILLPGWLGLALIITDHSLPGRWRLRALSFLGGALFLWLAGISLFGAHGPHAIRFLFTWVSLLVMLSGWGYALLFRALAALVKNHRPRLLWPARVSALLLLSLLFLPGFFGSVENLQHAMSEDPRNFVTDYMDRTLAAGRYVISRGTSTLFNRDWGGYAGETAFELASFDQPAESPVARWREMDVDYAILHYDDYARLSEADPFDYLGSATRLKGWEKQPDYRYTTMVVLRLHPIQHGATGRLGPIRLIGYELDEGNVRPGDALPFHLYWQATAATDGDYRVFNHLLDAEGKLVAQIDGPPLPDPLLRRGTSDWHDPEEIIFSREYLLQLSDDLPPGAYTLFTGFYRPETGQRLYTPTGEAALWLARIVVAAE